MVQGIADAISYPVQTLTDPTNLVILSFIPPIFTMVEITVASGGFAGIAQWLLGRAKNSTSAQAATAIISSIVSSCDLIQCVRTQLPCSLAVAGIALAFAYVPSSFGLAPAWSLGPAAMVVLVVLLSKRRSKASEAQVASAEYECRDA